MRRRSILIILGVGWMTYGVSLAMTPRATVVRGVSDLSHWVPMCWLALIWMLGGAAALLSGSVLPVRHQSPGFICLSAPAAAWGTAYAASAIRGYGPGIGGAAVWISIAVAVCIAAGLQDPLPLPISTDAGSDE